MDHLMSCVYHQTLQIIIECLAKKVMGEMEPEAAKELTLCWTFFPREWFRFSWNIPGTGVYHMIKVRFLDHLTLIYIALYSPSAFIFLELGMRVM